MFALLKRQNNSVITDDISKALAFNDFFVSPFCFSTMNDIQLVTFAFRYDNVSLLLKLSKIYYVKPTNHYNIYLNKYYHISSK